MPCKTTKGAQAVSLVNPLFILYFRGDMFSTISGATLVSISTNNSLTVKHKITMGSISCQYGCYSDYFSDNTKPEVVP